MGGRGGENPPSDYCFGFCIWMNQLLFFFFFLIIVHLQMNELLF